MSLVLAQSWQKSHGGQHTMARVCDATGDHVSRHTPGHGSGVRLALPAVHNEELAQAPLSLPESFPRAVFPVT